MDKIDGTHYSVELTEKEWRTVWLWIESAAPYAGSYAALRNDQEMNLAVQSGRVFWEQKQVLRRRCNHCHNGEKVSVIPFSAPDHPDKRGIGRPTARHERLVIENDPLARFSPHILLNLSRPELSPLLLGPLTEDAGGWGSCGSVFKGTRDLDYLLLLQSIRSGKETVDSIPRYSTAHFKPNRQYIREMKKYGVLPESFASGRTPMNCFETDRKYWRMLR
ncbi:MAG TPA: hypothetical protein EYG38_07935 [Verrucomicrobia bacterium]|nr:hypothetical protein [Verrucomicrobiota bacterium]